MHLRVRGCGGADDRALKAWEKKLHGSRTRIGKAGEARGAGVSAKEVPAPPPPPSSAHCGGWGWDGIGHWLRPPAPSPRAPPQPDSQQLGESAEPLGHGRQPLPGAVHPTVSVAATGRRAERRRRAAGLG